MKGFDQDPELGKHVEIQLTEIPAGNMSEAALTTPGVAEVKRWPQQPHLIQNEKPVEILLNLYDVGLCAVPIALMLKTSLCIYSYHEDQGYTGSFISLASPMSHYLTRFNTQLITIFTIVFILIVSTLVRRYALWKAERGATIAQLEQYQASISLPSTLKAIWSLRAFSLTSLGLVLLWCWIYIGSQAVEREFGLSDSGPLQHVNMTYMQAHATTPFDNNSFATFSPVQKTDMTSLYHLYSQRTRDPVAIEDYDKLPSWDLAGYALPVLYDMSSEQPDKHGWSHILSSTSAQKASSIGHKIYAPSSLFAGETLDDGTWYAPQMIGKYLYNTSYINMNCSVPVYSDTPAPNGTVSTFSMFFNMTSINGTLQNDTPREFNFWSYYNSSLAVTSVCNISEIFVEYGVECAVAGCKTTKMRYQPGTTNPTWRTRFDNNQFASDFINSLLYACGRPTSIDDLTTFEQDNGLTYFYNIVADGYEDFGELFANTSSSLGQSISNSLTRYFNTFLTASQRMMYDVNFEQQLAKDDYITIASTNSDFVKITMKGAVYSAHYAITWPWIVLDYCSSLILLVAAATSYWLRVNTLAPDIFGYVSSLTRENPQFDLHSGTTLNGIERARKMKNVKVKIGDLNADEGVGKVGLTYLGGNNVQHVGGLQKDRHYV